MTAHRDALLVSARGVSLRAALAFVVLFASVLVVSLRATAVYAQGTAVSAATPPIKGLLPPNTVSPVAERGAFFSKGSAISPFLPAPAVGEQEAPEFFPRSNTFEPAVEEEEEAPAKGQKEKGAADPAKKGEDPALAKLPPRERLLAKYGDPQKDAPVLAVESAPAPFRAMMEALHNKQDDMAFQYAKQYVRHLRNVKDRSTRTQSLVGFAMKREGMVEEGGWQGAPALIEDQALYVKDVEAAKQAEAGEGGDIELQARNLISEGKQEIFRRSPEMAAMQQAIIAASSGVSETAGRSSGGEDLSRPVSSSGRGAR